MTRTRAVQGVVFGVLLVLAWVLILSGRESSAAIVLGVMGAISLGWILLGRRI